MAAQRELLLNPIAWVQFQLNGGMKRLLAVCGIYALAMVLLNVFIYRATTAPWQAAQSALGTFAGNSLAFTLFISAAMLVVGGAGIINKAVMRDYTSDMITSHRSTAMTGHVAVFGYLTGPPSRIICLTFINWIACTVLAGLAGYPIVGPSFIFIIFGCMASVAWSAAALSGLCYRGKLSFAVVMVPLAIIFVIDPIRDLLIAHPGLALLVNYAGARELSGSAAGVAPEAVKTLVVSMLSQLVLAFIFFLAAARRFQRDDVPAFNPALAYSLLALCALISGVGLNYFNDYSTNFVADSLIFLPTQTFTTIMSLALVAILPISNAAWTQFEWARRIRKDPRYTGPRARSPVEAALCATVVACGVLALIVRNRFGDIFANNFVNNDISEMQAAICICVSFLLAMVAIAGMLRFVYNFVRNGVWALLMFLMLFWIAPLIGDLLMEVAYERQADEPKSLLFALSPIGTWVTVFIGGKSPVVFGLIGQAVIAGVMLILSRKGKY